MAHVEASTRTTNYICTVGISSTYLASENRGTNSVGYLTCGAIDACSSVHYPQAEPEGLQSWTGQNWGLPASGALQLASGGGTCTSGSLQAYTL